MKAKACLLSVLLGFTSLSAYAKSHFLILSGGDSPSLNHYSQYLQTRTLAHDLQKRFGKNNVTVFFGAGNHPGKPKILPDVHEKSSREDPPVDVMSYGSIDANRSAIKKNIVDFFKTTAARLDKKDTLFLLISDHGMPNIGDDTFTDNCINLWTYDAKNHEEGKHDPDWKDRCLSRSELSTLLKKHVKTRRTLFGMSQCFGGGFHYLSVDPDADYPTADTDKCGFTAVPQDLIASGCTDDVEADRYQGYERYFTEQITGKDVVTGRSIRGGRNASLTTAHEAAILRDKTVDVPMTTSDFYLMRWYDKLWEKKFAPRSGDQSGKNIQSLMNKIESLEISRSEIETHAGELAPLLHARFKRLDQTITALAGHTTVLKDVFSNGSEADLNDHLASVDRQSLTLNNDFAKWDKRARKIFYTILYRPWLKALKNNEVKNITKTERKKFELDYFSGIEKQIGKNPDLVAALDNEFLLTLSDTTHNDPKLARDFARYKVRRENKIIEWALTTGDSRLVSAAKELTALRKKIEGLDAPIENLSRETSWTQRVLEQRRQIAALVALNVMQDAQAMAEVKGLATCEGTGF